MAAPSENQKSQSSNDDSEIDKELNELLDGTVNSIYFHFSILADSVLPRFSFL